MLSVTPRSDLNFLLEVVLACTEHLVGGIVVGCRRNWEIILEGLCAR
jgi:hypothetical protein